MESSGEAHLEHRLGGGRTSRTGALDYRAVFDATPDALLLLDTELHVVDVNPAMTRASGLQREAMVGRSVFEVFPTDPERVGDEDVDKLRASLEHVLGTGREHVMATQRYDVRDTDGTFRERYWNSRNIPILDDDGRVTLVLHRAEEVTDLLLAETSGDQSVPADDGSPARTEVGRTEQLQRVNAVLRTAYDRVHLLTRVTQELIGTLDRTESANRLAQLLVPALADWCIVSLLEDDDDPSARERLHQNMRDVGTWHREPDSRELVDAYAQVRLPALRDDSVVAAALRLERRMVVTHDATPCIAAMIDDPDAERLLVRLAPDAVVVVPVLGRDRVVGLLSLYNDQERGTFSTEDVDTITDVALAAGLAFDNARLYRQQVGLAEGLQRAALTAPAQPDHCEVVVRYAPASEAAQIGGDWYDAFLQPSGAMMLVVGDVLGHDTSAAATMGQVRTTVRTIAVHADAAPSAVLAGADLAMRTLQTLTTATAVVARLEQDADDLAEGRTVLRWSNAGHPPPVVIHPDGQVQVLDEHPNDLLLGIAPDDPRTDWTVELCRGATVLMYTDGLVERRTQSLRDGIDRLVTHLEQPHLRHLTLDDLCDDVLANLLSERPGDDVALVAVRLHPQDRPRPPEAPPERIPDDVPPDPA